MGEAGRFGQGAALTRAALELRLAAMALSVRRALEGSSGHPHRDRLRREAAVSAFIDESEALLLQASRRHRAYVIERLAALASTSGLGIIGFEQWLESAARMTHGADRTGPEPHDAAATARRGQCEDEARPRMPRNRH